MVDLGRDAGRSAESCIGDAEAHVEARRRILFLKKLGVEDAAIELGCGLGIGNGEADVLESGGVQGQRSGVGGVGSQQAGCARAQPGEHLTPTVTAGSIVRHYVPPNLA